MPKGNNQFTKKLVQAGQLCYICTKAKPTMIDDVGGHVCRNCFIHMETGIFAAILKQGYQISVRKEAEA